MSSQLDSSQFWYELPAVAEAAPVEFLREGWKWLVDTCEKEHGGWASSIVNHYGGDCIALDNEEGDPVPPILASYYCAIDDVARQRPSEFVEITEASWESENAVVHRLLIRGLCLVAETMPSIGLHYLLGDKRRFQVGSISSHEQSESVRLIRAIAPRLLQPELRRLENAVLSWSRYRNDVTPPEGKHIVWDRESCLRLLDAIGSDFLSEPSRRLLEREKRELTGWDRQGVGRARAGFVRQLSPISKETMLEVPNEQILKAIEDSPASDHSARNWVEVEGGWEEPGGASATGNEIAELLNVDSARAMEIIHFLVEKGSEEAASQAIHGFADSDVGDTDALPFLQSVCRLRPQSVELRSNLGYALYRRCRPGVGLPDELCDILHEWLTSQWISDAGTEENSNARSDRKQHGGQSVLWSRGELLSLSRAFFPLIALTNGYLMRSPPACNEWLDSIETLLPLDIPKSTWGTYAKELRWIRLKACDTERGASIVQKFFQQFPSLVETRAGMQLIAHIGDLLTADVLEALLRALRDSANYQSRQGYGELVTLIAFRGHHDPWASDLLESELSELETGPSRDDAIGLGLAFAASHLWDDSIARANSSNVICRQLPNASARVAAAIATVFWTEVQFPADEPTRSLFRACANNPASLANMSIVGMLEQLEPLTVHMRNLARDVCRAILKVKREEHELFEAGPGLVKIAMTLQRFSDTRADGLSLLEEMLRIGLDDAFRILRDIDVRPESGKQLEPRVRRRRRSRK